LNWSERLRLAALYGSGAALITFVLMALGTALAVVTGQQWTLLFPFASSVGLAAWWLETGRRRRGADG
jgi:hypothetical protein